MVGGTGSSVVGTGTVPNSIILGVYLLLFVYVTYNDINSRLINDNPIKGSQNIFYFITFA